MIHNLTLQKRARLKNWSISVKCLILLKSTRYNHVCSTGRALAKEFMLEAYKTMVFFVHNYRRKASPHSPPNLNNSASLTFQWNSFLSLVPSSFLQKAAIFHLNLCKQVLWESWVNWTSYSCLAVPYVYKAINYLQCMFTCTACCRHMAEWGATLLCCLIPHILVYLSASPLYVSLLSFLHVIKPVYSYNWLQFFMPIMPQWLKVNGNLVCRNKISKKK